MKTKIQTLPGLFLLTILFLATTVSSQNTNPTQAVCPGSQNYWVVPGNIANTFTWTITPGVSGSDWTITPNGNNYTVIVDWSNVANPVDYTLTITETSPAPNSCSISKSVIITVNPTPAAPTASATLQPNCTVSTGTITVTAPTGPGMTYSIDGSTYTNTDGIFLMVAAGTYNVTAKNSQGCISTGTTVTINAQPLTPVPPTVSIEQPTCAISTAILTVISPVPGAGISYTLTGTNPVVASVTNTTGIFAGLSPGIYDVTTTNASGCTSNATISTIDSQPLTPVTSPIWHN